MESSQAPRRPYAATANVVAVLTRVRTRNMPERLDNDFLRIAGIGDVVFGRVRDALHFLRLVNEDDEPTDVLRSLAAAPEAEYRELLAATLRDAYSEDFRNIDPAQDEQGRIIDAFRRYEPRSQTPRMVMLFLGLAREAGIPVRDAPRERQMTTRQTNRSVRRPTQRGRSPASPPTSPVTPGTQRQESNGRAFQVGFTDADLAELTDEEFGQIWGALGRVTLARARAKTRAATPLDEAGDDA